MSFLRRLFGGAGGADDDPGARLVVVDTETSGLDAERDELLAIGAVAVEDGSVLPGDSFEVVLQNAAAGDATNVAVHGIGYGAQAAGMPAAEALAAFRDFVGDSRCVGYHVDFDRKVLARACAAANVPFDGRPWLDLAQLVGALEPARYRAGARSLDDWLGAYAIGNEARHNAAGDALATAELLLRLRAKAAGQGAKGFSGLLRAASQQKWLGG